MYNGHVVDRNRAKENDEIKSEMNMCLNSSKIVYLNIEKSRLRNAQSKDMIFKTRQFIEDNFNPAPLLNIVKDVISFFGVNALKRVQKVQQHSGVMTQETRRYLNINYKHITLYINLKIKAA